MGILKDSPRRRTILWFVAVGVVLALALGAVAFSGAPLRIFRSPVSCQIPLATRTPLGSVEPMVTSAPWPVASSYLSRPPLSGVEPIVTEGLSLPRDEPLERTLPETVFGYEKDKFAAVSGVGRASMVEGQLRAPLVTDCLSPRDATVHYAFARWPDVEGIAATAIRVDGVSGTTLRDWYAAIMADDHYSLNWESRTAGSRAYQADRESNYALYPTADTLYVVWPACCVEDWCLAAGYDCPSPAPTPYPPIEAIWDEVIRQLP